VLIITVSKKTPVVETTVVRIVIIVEVAVDTMESSVQGTVVKDFNTVDTITAEAVEDAEPEDAVESVEAVEAVQVVLNYSHSRIPPCAPARTHGQIQAPREPPN
jgi:hypothetical protein